MNILLVSPSFYPATSYGGPIFSTLNLCNALNAGDISSLKVVTTNANMGGRLDIKSNVWLEDVFDFPIKYYNETVVDRFSLPMLFLLWLDILRADIVVAQSVFSAPTPLSILYATILKKKIIVAPRGSFSKWALNNGSNFKKTWINIFIKPFANRITWHATSNEEKSDIEKLFPRSEVVVIPNGINTSEYSFIYPPTPKEKNDFFNQIAPDLYNQNVDIAVISMGRLHKVKGFDILIEAFKNVHAKKKNAFLFIAGGDVGELKNLSSKVKQLGLDDSVFFVGELKGNIKLKFLSYGDMFVLPSYTENFGNVYLESLASGTPIVASTNTPWSVVNDYYCGFYIDNTVSDTTKAMDKILEGNAELFSQNAIKLASKFDWSYIANDFKCKLFD